VNQKAIRLVTRKCMVQRNYYWNNKLFYS